MKKIFKKFLILCCITIGGIFLTSNKCFAENYKVRIIVLGNRGVGKSNIVNILKGSTFNTEHVATIWENSNGTKGFHIQRPVNGNMYDCYFYDAPGFDTNDNDVVWNQIAQANLADKSLAIVVIDFKDKRLKRPFDNSLHEALAEHVNKLKRRNANCHVILVINKSDLLSPDEMNKVNETLGHATKLFGYNFLSPIIISARLGTNFAQLNSVIDNFLHENKDGFERGVGSSFSICANPKCPKKEFSDEEEVRSWDSNSQNRYCSERCRGIIEGKKCTFDGEYFAPTVPGVYGYKTSKWYCSDEHKRAAGDTFCSVM